MRSRLNHYEVLGISPTASGDEIARAFAREGSVFRPQAFGALAELCVAYETLRDPVKRRAYDASLGLNRQNRPVEAQAAFVARAPVAPAPVRRQAPAPQPTPQPRLAPASPALPLGSGSDLQASPEPRIGRGDLSRHALEEELGVEARPIDLRRTGILLGTLVVAACALGGTAGWWSASSVGEAAQPKNAASLSLPPAKRIATPAAPEPAVVDETRVAKKRIDRPKRAIAEEAPIASEPAPAEEQIAEIPTEPSPIEQAEAAVPAASTVAAAMPLPNRVIARTIERIGFSCGSVVATAAVEGEGPGVYKVTCGSGQSFQARPVNGRYRFRRWGGR